MIGAWAAALLLGQAANSSPSGWEIFDQREMGLGETAFLYDRSSVRRGRAGAPTAWVTWDFHYSGRNPTTHVELWQLDCARRRSRVVRALLFDQIGDSAVERPAPYRPIAPASAEAALAGRLCR